ncbi:hypothetical protein LY78DRAFT_163980 [Colletotrichum sublineola]|nr:hypothetical protein LY78DRAFT_163980 [Colletotrichum sublineola]
MDYWNLTSLSPRLLSELSEMTPLIAILNACCCDCLACASSLDCKNTRACHHPPHSSVQGVTRALEWDPTQHTRLVTRAYLSKPGGFTRPAEAQGHFALAHNKAPSTSPPTLALFSPSTLTTLSFATPPPPPHIAENRNSHE